MFQPIQITTRQHLTHKGIQVVEIATGSHKGTDVASIEYDDTSSTFAVCGLYGCSAFSGDLVECLQFALGIAYQQAAKLDRKQRTGL